MQVYKQTGRKPAPLLNLPDFPVCMTDLWDWYQDLLSGGAVTYTEIKSWADLMGYRLFPVEVQALRRLYAIYMRVSDANSVV